MNRLIDSFLDYLKYERNYSVHTIISYAEDLKQFEEYVKENQGGEFSPDIIDRDIVRHLLYCM